MAALLVAGLVLVVVAVVALRPGSDDGSSRRSAGAQDTSVTGDAVDTCGDDARRSTVGAGAFGAWTDQDGLPAYDLTDRRHLGRAATSGRDIGWHLFGNDRVVALADTDGAVQQWSADRRQQWVNKVDESAGEVGGGFGYVEQGDRTVSTQSVDAGRDAVLRFGIGSVHRCRTVGSLVVLEDVYAPFGDDPLLLHDVTLSNPSDSDVTATWHELWDLDPVVQSTHEAMELEDATYDASRRLVSTVQVDPDDDAPLTLFAAALRSPESSYGTSPDVTDESRAAGPPGAFTFASPVTVAAGTSVTLRYAFGATPGEDVHGLVDSYADADDPLAASEQAWRAWLPRVRLLGVPDAPALEREAAWTAAQVRQGATYDATCGHHVVSQGGYYQYGFGVQLGLRDPLQHALGLIWTDPALALENLRYAARLQSPDGELPFGVDGLCTPIANDGQDDLDVWLLMLAAEYGLATRDVAAFDEALPGSEGDGSLWDRLEVAVDHQEGMRGPHGGYLVRSGDWSDGSRKALGMTESLLETTQLAYVYRRLAAWARAADHRAFARRLGALAARDVAVVRRNVAPGGWVQRGWDRGRPIGRGTIFGEPQGWALLSGALPPEAERRLVAAVGRHLTAGSRIGSAQVPARGSPAGRERSKPFPVAGDGAAAYLGGVWYAVNGWWVWGLATAADEVPAAARAAVDEWRRNSLTAHATAFPRAWSGVLSTDDVCAADYAPDPARCGLFDGAEVDTLNMHQPAWETWGLAVLAGLTATEDGYWIDPALSGDFRVRYPRASVARDGVVLSGSVRPVGKGRIDLDVAEVPPGRLRVTVDGRGTPYLRTSDGISFRVTTQADTPVRWRVAPR